jgi:hypothetical protein
METEEIDDTPPIRRPSVVLLVAGDAGGVLARAAGGVLAREAGGWWPEACW